MQHSVSTENGFMQVDELDNHANPSTHTKLRSVSPTTQSRICISDEVLHEMGYYKQLERNIETTFNDDDIRSSLAYVWLSVYRVLEKIPKMRTLLANLEEFQRNVVQKGEQQFINLLRDMAEKKKSWRDLLENGTPFLCFVLEHSDHLLFPDVFLK